MILLFTPPFAKAAARPGVRQGLPRRAPGERRPVHARRAVVGARRDPARQRGSRRRALPAARSHPARRDARAGGALPGGAVRGGGRLYAAPGHVGRGGWSWYTGSASWMYRIGVESILGVTRHGASLHIAPCIPSSWPRYEVTYRHRTSRYRFVVENPEGRCGGVVRIEVDGAVLPSAAIPLQDDGREHQVRVVLGGAPEPIKRISLSSQSLRCEHRRPRRSRRAPGWARGDRAVVTSSPRPPRRAASPLRR